MALLKFKKFLEDVETGSHQVIDLTTIIIPTATSAGKAGTAAYAGTAEVAVTGTSGSGL